MKQRDKKNIKQEYAKKNINLFFYLLETRFYPQYDNKYIKEIQKISQGFNIRLKREQKLRFCKKCLIYLDSENKWIRLNSRTLCIEHICKNCGDIRRFKYK